MISEVSKQAAIALFRQEPFHVGNVHVHVSRDKAVLHVGRIEVAKIENNKLAIRNEGKFTTGVLDKINGVLKHAGHELLHRKDWCWRYESSQTPFGDGINWKEVKL